MDIWQPGAGGQAQLDAVESAERGATAGCYRRSQRPSKDAKPVSISPTAKDCKDNEKGGPHTTAKTGAMCQRALRMIPGHALRTFATKAHALKYGTPTQKANLVLTEEEWEEIKKKRAEMRSTKHGLSPCTDL